jgi:hypothetical protein
VAEEATTRDDQSDVGLRNDTRTRLLGEEIMANEHNYLSRTIIASVGSVVLTFISWVGAVYVTLGVEVARRMDYEPILSNFGERIKIAFAADCVVWFAMTWGTRGLWTQFRKDVREHSGKRQWVNPLRDAATLCNSTLCALPLSYYLVRGMVMLFDNGRMPKSDFWFIVAMAMGLAACALVICGLFAVAVRCWPDSWLPSDKSDNSRITTLNLR